MNFLKRLFGGNDIPFAPVEADRHENENLALQAPAPSNTIRPEETVPLTKAAPQFVYAGPWRARPLFISSTFRDMHAERDHLRDKVFPELEERLRARRQSLEPIDLRLGVEIGSLEDEQHTRELQVLKVCLAEIERSRPFLLVLLGDRYGWVPPEAHVAAATQEAGFAADTLSKSVTALEIEFGILRSNPGQRLRSRFYFRDPLPYEDMPTEEAAIYSDAYSPDQNVRNGGETLQLLKETISCDPNLKDRVRRYSLDWDLPSHAPTQSSLEAWGRQVFEDLWSDIEEETREYATEKPVDKDEQERQAIEEFAQVKLRDFKGRDDLLRTLEDCAFSPTNNGATWGACVKGEPGSGKSSLFSALYCSLHAHVAQGEEKPPLILANAAGSTPRSSRIDAVLLRFVKELSSSIGHEPPLGEGASPEDVDRTFGMLLEKAARHRRVIILLDALDQFDRSTRSRRLTWIPVKHWPLNARLLATSLPGQAAESLEQWVGVEEIDLPAVEEAQARDIARGIWRRYHRECNPEVLSAVLGRRQSDGLPCYGNPLWLTLAMEHLNLLDAEDFNRAGQNIHGLLMEMATMLPLDISGLYALLLARCEKLFGMAWTRSFACLTALGRTGWREYDFMSLIPETAKRLLPDAPIVKWDPLRFASIRRGFRSQLIQRGEHGEWDFSHQQLRSYTCQAYLWEANVVDQLQELIATHLFGLPEDDHIRQTELMHHAIQSKNGACAASCLSKNIVSRDHVRDIIDFIQNIDLKSQHSSYDWLLSLFKGHSTTLSEIYSLTKCFLFCVIPEISGKTTAALRVRILEDIKSVLGDYAVNYENNKKMHFILAMTWNSIGKERAALGDTITSDAAFNASTVEFETAENCCDIDEQSGSYVNRSYVEKQVSDEFRHALSEATEAFMRAIDTVEEDQLDLGDIDENTASSISSCTKDSVANDALSCELPDIFTVKPFEISETEHELIIYGPLKNSLSKSVALIESGSTIEAKHNLIQLLEKCTHMTGFSDNRIMQQLTRAIAERLLAKISVAEGDMHAARSRYDSCVGILDNIVANHPDDTASACARVESLIEYGEFLVISECLDEARGIFSECLTTARSFVEANPEDVTTRLLLVKVYDAFGRLLLSIQLYDEALALIHAGLAICKDLIAIDSSNVIYIQFIASMHYNIGEALSETGNASGALENYQSCLINFNHMEYSISHDALLKRKVILANDRIGDILNSTGCPGKALEHYAECQRIFYTIGQDISCYSMFTHQLLIIQEKIGTILQSQGDISGALHAFQSALETSCRLNAEHPEETLWQMDKLIYSFKTAEAQALIGDTFSALNNFQTSLQISQKLIQKEPKDTFLKRSTWASHYKISMILKDSGDITYLEHLRKTYELLLDAKLSNVNITESETSLLHDLCSKFLFS